MSEQAELKRLAPVVAAATGAATRLQGLHGRALSLVPEAYKPSVEQREQQLAALASPYLTALSDRAPALLHAVDAKVDGAIMAAWASFTANRAAVGAAAQHARHAGLEQLSAARQAYLSRLEESLAFVRAQGLQGTAKAAADALLGRVEEAKRALPSASTLLGDISKAWSKLAATPAVERLLQASRAQVDGAYARYLATHDALVADPRYASAVAKGSELLSAVQATSAYQAAAGRLTPYLAPAAESIAPLVAKAAAHLAPAAA
ncbi:hypothetical protein ABPG75_008849 [Micractinium tetrahymenae]